MGEDIPDEFDCKCEGGGSTAHAGSRTRDRGIRPSQFVTQKQAAYLFEDRGNVVSYSDAYSPYGMAGESFIRTDTEKA